MSLIDLLQQEKTHTKNRANPCPNNDGSETEGCGVKFPRIFDGVEAETRISRASFQII